MMNVRQIFLIMTYLGISITEYTLKPGEDGKYRYYLKDYQEYYLCCFCPLDAVMYQDYIVAFQIKECLNNNSTVDQLGNKAYPYCSCEAKMGLTPTFIGCILPMSKEIDWDCDNKVKYPNITVYTTCKPRCKDKNQVLVQQVRTYRCNEARQWENDPSSVHCEDKDKEGANVDISVVIVIVVTAAGGVVLFIFIITCWRRRWYNLCLTAREKCLAQRNGISSNIRLPDIRTFDSSESKTRTESTSIPDAQASCECSNSSHPSSSLSDIHLSYISETSFSTDTNQHQEKYKISHENDCYSSKGSAFTCREVTRNDHTSDDIQREEMVPLMSSIEDQNSLVKVSGSPEIRDGIIFYNQLLGQDVVITTKEKIDKKSDFTIDRPCAVQDERYKFLFIIKNVKKEHEGIYNWKLKVKEKIEEGSFHIIVNDLERQSPVGNENSLSLNFPSLTADSFRTIEEDVLEGNCSGLSNQNLAVVCHPDDNGLVDPLTTNSSMSHLSSSPSELTSENQESDKYMKCTQCNIKLCDALDDYTVSKHLENICIMLDPKPKSELQCWIGFLKFYRCELKLENHHIQSIRYHRKGDPNNGHMHYILTNYLPQNGFTVGHIVYYFSRKESRRKDVLSRIGEFHKNCQFCDRYIKTSEKCFVQ